jgi:gamma-glutamyltranspeptidase/glutathione hydrolase
MRSIIVLGLMLVLSGAPVLAAPGAGKGMVDAANPLAVEAGLEVLRVGGTAVDAAVAVQATLGLVEPQSSGIGGGAFLTYFDARTRKVTAYDGREMAPAGAAPEMFLKADGKPMGFAQAMLSGRSAGVPGAVAMLYLAQHEHGRRPWASLFSGAEGLAREGFIVSPRLAGLIASTAPQAAAVDVVAYFTNPDGSRTKTGDRLRNPAYAATLRRIADEGPSALLTGPIADDIVRRLREGPLPGTMTLADLAGYRPHEAPALCRPYRKWLICEPNAPAGGPATLEGLGLLERTDIAKRGPDDPKAWFELAQAERLMYADDMQYIADPAFVAAPVEGLLAADYLDRRAKLIGETAGPAPAPGIPAGAPSRGVDRTREPGGTSSFVIVDPFGNVVSMTTTVESLFGDGRMVDGFLLNNQLTDFSFTPIGKDGAPAANAAGPRKRPRSSMSPTIILDQDHRFVAAVGSPGGLAIPAYVLKAVVSVLDWNMSMQDAIALPNLIAIGDSFIGEADKFSPAVLHGLADRGITVRGGYAAEGSGLHGVILRGGRLDGGADPRREGVARTCC